MKEKSVSVIYAGGTDRGKVRQQNEDCILMAEFEHSDVVLLIVADGVGGHEGGEVASKLTVELMKEAVAKAVLQAQSGGGYGEDWLKQTLHHAVTEANTQIIREQTIRLSLHEMATTVVAMLIHNNEMVISYLGDSRCYRYNQQHIEQLTEDHTMLQKLLNEGKIDQQEFEAMPMHHMISQAIGISREPDVQVSHFEFNHKSSYLLCSDGLTNCVSDAQIQHILQQHSQLESAVDELITCANDNGGTDNISVVLVESVSG